MPTDTTYDKFTTELDWSPESWFSLRARKPDGTLYNKEEAERLASHIPEYLDIERAAKANGTWLKMPDGSIWKGDPRSWVMMQSNAYKQNYSNTPWYTGQAEWSTTFDYPNDSEGAVATNKVTRAPYYDNQMWFSDSKDYGDTFANYQNSTGLNWRFDTPGEENVKGKNFLAAIPKEGNYRVLEADKDTPDYWRSMPYKLNNDAIERLPNTEIKYSKNRNALIRTDRQQVLTDDVVNWSKDLGDQGIFLNNVDDGDVIINDEIRHQPVNEFISQPGFTKKVKFIEGNTGDFDITNPYKYAYNDKVSDSNYAAYGGPLVQQANVFGGGGKNYNSWKKKLKNRMHINVDSDNTYDYEGYYNSNPEEAWKIATGDPEGHFPDDYKTVYHPTFSNHSIYDGKYHPKYNPQALHGGRWEGNKYIVHRDQYHGPVDFDERLDYLQVAENNGVSLREADGTWPEFDGIPLAGVLPNVTVTGQLGGKHVEKPDAIQTYADGGELNAYKQWQDLSIKEKADMIKVGVKNGLTNMSDIRQKYNEFANGGNLYPNGGWRDIAKYHIRRNEGFRQHSYADAPKGKSWRSVGYGFNDSGFYSKYPMGISKYYDSRGGITRQEAEQELDYMLNIMENQARRAYGSRWNQFNDNQKAAIMDTMYQRPASVLKGSQFYKAVMAGDPNAGNYLGVTGYANRNNIRRGLFGNPRITIPQTQSPQSLQALHQLVQPQQIDPFEGWEPSNMSAFYGFDSQNNGAAEMAANFNTFMDNYYKQQEAEAKAAARQAALAEKQRGMQNLAFFMGLNQDENNSSSPYMGMFNMMANNAMMQKE